MGKMQLSEEMRRYIDENYLECTQGAMAKHANCERHHIAYYMKIKGYKIPEHLFQKRCKERYHNKENPKFRKPRTRESKTYEYMYAFAKKLGFENTTSAIGKYGARPFKKKFKEYQAQNN